MTTKVGGLILDGSNNAMQPKGLHSVLASMQLHGADFVDLGSGMGMPCFAAMLVFNARSGIGLEQLTTNVDWCNASAQKLPPLFRPVFVSGDILDVEHLTATRIYAFDAVYLPCVQEKIVCGRGARVAGAWVVPPCVALTHGPVNSLGGAGPIFKRTLLAAPRGQLRQSRRSAVPNGPAPPKESAGRHPRPGVMGRPAPPPPSPRKTPNTLATIVNSPPPCAPAAPTHGRATCRAPRSGGGPVRPRRAVCQCLGCPCVARPHPLPISIGLPPGTRCRLRARTRVLARDRSRSAAVHGMRLQCVPRWAHDTAHDREQY